MGSLASLKSFMVALLHTVRATDSHKSGFLKYNGDNSISGTKLQHWFPKMHGYYNGHWSQCSHQNRLIHGDFSIGQDT